MNACTLPQGTVTNLQHARPDFRTLRVEQQGNPLPWALLESLLKVLDHTAMCLMITMREVKTAHVHPGIDQLHHLVHIPAAGAHRAHNLRAVRTEVLIFVVFQDLGHADIRTFAQKLHHD